MSLTPSDTPDPPSLFLVLGVVVGLPVSLWVYKCLMLILFQRKIIYMSYAPPGARHERLQDEHVKSMVPQCLVCEEVRFVGEDGVKLAGLVIRENRESSTAGQGNMRKGETKECMIMYLQGNAGNPLHRIPVFSNLLSSIGRPSTKASSIAQTSITDTTIFSPAPRSYWLSSRRSPTQRGVISDYVAALKYAASNLKKDSSGGDDVQNGPPVVLYGHSLGATAASHIIVSLALGEPSSPSRPDSLALLRRIRGVIFENPFTSTPDMLRELYPNKWMPYRYLGGFIWDKWDVERCLRRLDVVGSESERGDEVVNGGDGMVGVEAKRLREECVKEARRILRDSVVLVSEKDEVVPSWMGKRVWEVCQEAGRAGAEADVKESTLPSGKVSERGTKDGDWAGQLVTIPDALHENAWRKRRWREVVGSYIVGLYR